MWEGLDAAELAAALSSVLYESRRDAYSAPDGADIPTGALRRAAAQAGRADHLSLWAGQGVAQVRPMPAAELVAVQLTIDVFSSDACEEKMR